MGSFVYMIARDDADIIEEKRLEFEERLEKVFNATGMMEQEHLTLFGKGIRALRPVRIENGYTTFFYNYFEDDVWENAGYYNKNGGVYSEKVGWRNFARAIEAAYMLQMFFRRLGRGISSCARTAQSRNSLPPSSFCPFSHQLSIVSPI